MTLDAKVLLGYENGEEPVSKKIRIIEATPNNLTKDAGGIFSSQRFTRTVVRTK